MDKELIGYIKFAEQLENKILKKLSSVNPCENNGLTIRGERRCGRSTFFNFLSEKLERSEKLNCFVSDIPSLNLIELEDCLLKSIDNNNNIKNNYSNFKGKLLSSDGFFELCDKLNQEENKIPIFLIDMGRAFENSLNKNETKNIIEISRYFKYVFNLMGDKNIKFFLVVGLTNRFVSETEEIVEDVWIQRYQQFLT